MLTPLRKRLRELMAEMPCRRPPVLRRSDAQDMLLATDLPLLTEEASLSALLSRLEAEGWRTRQERGWLLLDHALEAPPCTGEPEGEGACVLRLLSLHPGGGMDEDTARLLARAEEQGPRQTERLLSDLHHRYAAMLRLHLPLPEELIPYVRHAALRQLSQP